jgi:pimeloyl-ACP methyl ester carboxylesterase
MADRDRRSTSDALAYLQGQGANIRNIAAAGHSLGAMAAVRAAAMWTQLPSIRAIILHEPAGRDFTVFSFNFTFAQHWITPQALQEIACATHVLIVRAQTSAPPPESPDTVNSAAIPIWNSLPQISRYTGAAGRRFRRNFLHIPHDDSHPNDDSSLPNHYRESGHLVVEAFPPTSMAGYGCWKSLMGGLNRAFFRHAPLSSPYCNAPITIRRDCWTTRSMGTWSDAVPATAMKNAADLGLFPDAVIPDYCLPSISRPPKQTRPGRS